MYPEFPVSGGLPGGLKKERESHPATHYTALPDPSDPPFQSVIYQWEFPMSMYASSIPAAIRCLNNLSAILAKGAAFCEEKGIEGTVLTSARLAPDMFPLARQVQIACDSAKGCGARLSGTEAPKHEDNETTFEELQARIKKTVSFLETLKPASIDGTEDKEIKFKAGPYELEFTGQSYLCTFVLPNLYFHTTTAYNILRHNGVAIGKMDYLGK